MQTLNKNNQRDSLTLRWEQDEMGIPTTAANYAAMNFYKFLIRRLERGSSYVYLITNKHFIKPCGNPKITGDPSN